MILINDNDWFKFKDFNYYLLIKMKFLMFMDDTLKIKH